MALSAIRALPPLVAAAVLGTSAAMAALPAICGGGGKSSTAPVLRALARYSIDAPVPLLSDRELEVLECMVDGLTTQQMAVRLFISENTVKTHVRHIFEKLEVSNRAEAVGKAMQMGLVKRKED